MKILKVILRNLLSQKLFTGLNLLGLSVGLTCVLIISLWVYNESGYDKFNSNFERICQINFRYPDGGTMAGSPAPLAPVIEQDVAAIEKAARLRGAPSLAFKYEENMYFEENGITADPQIFDIFSFKPVIGDPKKALEKVNGIVITQSFANRYFGSDNPIDKELLIEGKDYVIVGAVIENIPLQSHIQFDFILSQKLVEEAHFCGLEWGDPNFRTYILLNDSGHFTDVAESITESALAKGMPHVKYGEARAFLRPLKSIYLDYTIPNRLGETGDFRYLYIFSSIALLILILACINFINLTISLYAKKQKDTSIKKVCGASRTAVFGINIIENGIIVLIAFVLAILALWHLDFFFQSVFGKQFNVGLIDTEFVAIAGLIFMTAILLCTVYPSVVFSSVKAIDLLNRYNKRKSGFLRNMVIFQNIIAVLLIIAAIGVGRQMQYINHKKLGFDTDRVAYTYLRGNISEKISVVWNSLQENPNIMDICMKDCVPYNQRNGTVGISWKVDGEWKNQDEGNPIGMETTRIDTRYFDMMGVAFSAGRNFSDDIAGDKQNYIVNEEAVRLMGLEDPVGTEFMLYGAKGIIVGVIKDTNFKSLHQKVNPQVYHLYKDEAVESYFSALFFKIHGNSKEALAHVEDVWIKNNPGIPFEYHFLDQDYKNLYEKDIRIAGMLNLFTILAVFIASLGLFGQSVIASRNKIKEIGIRKVNGAQISEVLIMLNKDFAIWIGSAFVIAAPIGWYAMHKWLENFAYKTTLSWWIFALAGFLAMGIALLTVNWQSWKAARRNPVESLRYD